MRRDSAAGDLPTPKDQTFRSKLLEELTFIIGQIYDASIDPALWDAALAKIALSLGTFKSALTMEHPAVEAPGICASCGSDASSQPVDDDAQDRLTLIKPHVARAAAIGRMLERARLEARISAEILDHVQSAILLLDNGGRVVQANLSARRYLASGAILRTAQGVLRMHDPKATAVLDRAIASARDRAIAPGTAPVTMALQSAAGERYFASVLPLTSGMRPEIGDHRGMRPEIGDHRHAVAALFIRRIGLDLPIDPTPLGRSYELTPRELTVMIAVVESGGVPEAATILALSENTVRTHLQSINRKTGARNQSELARLAASAGAGWH
jgi:DNA-binding CsgD family transcriptional regulator